MNLTRTIVYGNFQSKLHQIVTGDGTSIVKRLAYRSLTGRGLHIHIHQHLGYRLHLVWDTTRNGKETSKCIERRVLMYQEVTDFCEELMSKAFEGMCDWVCIHVIDWLKDNVGSCQVLITTQSQKSILLPPVLGTNITRNWKIRTVSMYLSCF